MKKYLFTSAAALAFCGLFTSCTHEFEGSSAQNSVMKTYEQAFVTAFGQPDPNQEWGFGSSTVAGVRGGTRAVPGITFPTFKDGDCPSMPTKYKNTLTDAIAAGAKYAKDYQNYQKGDVIYINTEYQTLNNPQNTDNLTIYVDGNVTYLGSTSQNDKGTTFCVTEGSTLKLGKVCERLTIYLAPNATLDISERLDENGNKAKETIYPDWNGWQAVEVEPTEFIFTKENAALYMNTGSKVLGDNLYFKDGYTVLNEGDSIKTNELHVENGAVLYNKNVITATGVIALRNTNGEIDNFGTMTGASMTLDASARFYNVAGGVVNISGLTKINNDSGYNAWMNSGQFNTGAFEILGGCQDPAAFNNCHMSVTNKFFMNHGNFVLDGGAAVECGSFEWQSDNFFHMGGKALLKVTGQMLMNNQNSSPNYGFWGDDSEYAVIQAGSVEKGSEGKYRAAYYGNLFIDTNDHFGQGRSSADGPWYYFADKVKFSFNDKNNHEEGAKKAENFSITIPADPNGCTPGYGDDPGPDPDAIRVICEDLSVTQASDWDFNDVVFDVKLVENNSKVQITLRAAGGTLLLNVAGREVHELFKEFNPNATPAITSSSMVSTGSTNIRNKYTNINLKAPVFTIENNFRTTNVKEIARDIPVQVYKSVNGESKWFDIEWKKGDPSARIGVGTDYNWCDERVDIRDNFEADIENTGGRKFSTFNLYVKDILSEGWYNVTEVSQSDVNRY